MAIRDGGVSDGYAQPLDSDWATVISLLVSHGTEVNARYTSGYSALDVAVSRGNAGSAEVLRGYGVRCFVQTGPLCGEVHVAVNFSSSGAGTVSAEGDGGALSDGGEIRQGATVMFTATPAAGHYVSGWSGNCADAGEVADGLDGAAKSCVAAADSDLSVRAEFSEIPSLAGPLCPSGSLSTNGMTQAQLDAGLITAAKADNLTNACEYLRRGANIEVVYTPALRSGDAIKRTPLVIAAANGRLELSRLLLNNGANVNWQSGRTLPESAYDGNAGWSALALAAAAGHGDVVGLLLDRGANVDIQWDFGRTALHEAAIFGRASVVELLLARGAAVDVRDLNGETALHGAAWGASPGGHHTHVSRSTWEAKWDKALDLLLDAGAEVNLRSTRTSDWGPAGRVFVNEGWNGGWTPLDRAVAANKRSRALKLRARGGVCNVQSGPLCPPSLVAVNFSSSGAGTVSAEGDGGALSDGGEIRQGATVMFTATPAAGHYVSGWSGNCADAGEVADGLDGAAKSCAAAADSDLSVRAEFSEIPSLAGPLCPSESLSANGLTTAELNMTLRLAARGGDAARACEALRRGAEVNDNLDDSEFTPLQEAVSGGHLDAVKLLLANGAEVNKRKDGAGHSPLDLAARDGEAEIAALLRNADGRCFVETGPLCQSVPVATPDPVTVVNTVAATVANTVVAEVENTVASTVAAGSCPAGTLDANGMTQAQLNQAMLGAVEDGDLEEVCEYLRRGADVNTYSTGRHAGIFALVFVRDNVEMAKLLLENGANVNRTGPGGDSRPPLFFTGWWLSPEVVRLYLSHGANPNFGGEVNWNPLHEAAYYNKWEIMKVLLTAGADPDIQTTRSGWRNGAPLHYVFDGTRSDSALAVSVLVAGNADVNLRDSGGNSALDLAANRGDAASAEILRAAGGQCFVSTRPLCGSAPAPAAAAESAPATDRLRERFAGAFNPSPAFGDAFGAASGSSQRFLGRLDSLMRSASGSGGNAWDSFAGWQRENEHGRMWFSTGQRGDFGFGAGVGGAGGDLSASPFAAMVGNGMLAGGETGLGADGKLRIAAFADYQARSLLDGTDRQWTKWAASGTAIETAMTEAERFSGLAENQTRGAMTEIHLGGDELGVALQAGAVSESDAMLSGTADDENLRGLRARTAFAGLSGAANLFGSGWRLRGSAHLGRSWAESESMLRDGDLWASAFSAGLERGGWLYSDDGFILRVSQPLRVESLEMELIGESGASRLGADPSGRQLDVDAAYRLPLSGGGWLLLSAGVRRDGGHTSSSDLEAGALFSVERGF